MGQSLILTSQKNQVLTAIRKHDLDPFNFSWAAVTSYMTADLNVSCIRYDGTGFFFRFDFLNDEHYSVFAPGEDKSEDTKYPGDWASQFSNVVNWLRYVKREIDEPDLWKDLAKFQLPEGGRLSPDISNEPFTAAQVDIIAEGLDRVRAYLESEVKLTAEHRVIVNDRLDYLTAAAGRQGRRDWLHTCIGVIVTISTAVGLAPNEVRAIWAIVKASVSAFVPLIGP